MQEKVKIFAVIVLYNMFIEESSTYNSIKDELDIEIFLCDNSTKEYPNKEYNYKRNVNYINMGGNVGLSKAYNRVLEEIGDREGILCLFDDDTTIPSSYFDKIRIAQKRDPQATVFLPIVYDDNHELLSPSLMRKYYLRRVSNISKIGENITGINSGMAINMQNFSDHKYRYNEKIFLDFIDHLFIRDMRKKGKKIIIVEDCILYQSFSVNQTDCEGAIARFKIFKKDVKSFYCDSFLGTCYYRYIVIIRTIKQCVKFKTLRFIKT